MVNFLSTKSAVWFFLFTTLVMFIIVMFIADPIIDNRDGFSVVQLQLAFDKELAEQIVSNWNIEAFKKWIVTDYIYALSYMLFFVSLQLMLFQSRHIPKRSWLRIGIYLALFAALCDWAEDSLELWFLSDMEHFSATLFFIHSLISSCKWLMLPVVLFIIFKTLTIKAK